MPIPARPAPPARPPGQPGQSGRPATVSDPAVAVRAVLRTRLTAAMKQRDRVAAGALRSVLGAIDNAEAVDPTPRTCRSPPVSTWPEPLSGWAPPRSRRRTLTVEEIRQIVEQEIEDRRLAVPQYQGAGERAAQRAADLQHEVETLLAALPDLPLTSQP